MFNELYDRIGEEQLKICELNVWFYQGRHFSINILLNETSIDIRDGWTCL